MSNVRTPTTLTPQLPTEANEDLSPWPARQVLIGCFIGLAFSCPVVYGQCFGLYLNAIVRDTGWDRAAVSLGFTIPALLAALLALPIGNWIDRAGPRQAILTGVLLFPLSLILLAAVPQQFTLFLGATLLIGIPAALIAPPTYLTLPPLWFDRNIGMATAAAATGAAIGSSLMPLLTESLISHHGWRGALWLISGLVALVGITNAVFLIRNNPGVSSTSDASPIAKVETNEALRDRRFWLLSLAFFLVMVVGAAYAVHVVAIFQDRGISAGNAALALMCFSLAALVAQIGGGAMIDRLPFWTAAALFFSGQLIGGAIMFSGLKGGAPYLAIGLIGAAVGAVVNMMPVTLRHMFGLRGFGRMLGIAFAMFSIGGALGPFLMGIIYDLVGSYQPAMILLMVIDLCAFALFVAAVGGRSANHMTAPHTE